MKKKGAAVWIGAAMAFSCFFGAGCTKASCLNTVCSTCNNGVACLSEQVGYWIDCGEDGNGIIFWQSEDKHDEKYVKGCYSCASDFRENGIGGGYAGMCICAGEMKKDLDTFLREDFPFEYSQTKQDIPNLKNYYKLTVTLSVVAPYDVTDLLVVFDLEEKGGPKRNSCDDLHLYFTSHVAQGETATASMTIFCQYHDNQDEELEDYVFTVERVYGKKG